jgi:hypothetical protein
MGQGVPRRLYKYRDFSNRTLSMLIDDIVYFADPTTFNDPLDTKPTLAADIDNPALHAMLARLIEGRTIAEMSAAAKTIRYRGPKTHDHIARHGRKAAERALADLRYNATDRNTRSRIPNGSCLAIISRKSCCAATTRACSRWQPAPPAR